MMRVKWQMSFGLVAVATVTTLAGYFQLLEMAEPTGLQTEFGPDDRGWILSFARWRRYNREDAMRRISRIFCWGIPPSRTCNRAIAYRSPNWSARDCRRSNQFRAKQRRGAKS